MLWSGKFQILFWRLILVQVMAWCHQASSHYLSQCWPRSMSSYGITRTQWVNLLRSASSMVQIIFVHSLVPNHYLTLVYLWLKTLDIFLSNFILKNALEKVLCKISQSFWTGANELIIFKYFRFQVCVPSSMPFLVSRYLPQRSTQSLQTTLARSTSALTDPRCLVFMV